MFKNVRLNTKPFNNVESGKYMLALLFLILGLVFSLDNSGIKVAEAQTGNVVFKYVDVETEEEINSVETEVVNGYVFYEPPEKVTVGGVEYTRLVATKPIEEYDVKQGKEYKLEYTSKVLTPKPNHINTVEESTEGNVNINEVLWRLKNGELTTNLDFEIGGKHAGTRLGTVSQTVGTDDALIEDESQNSKTENSMKKANNFKGEFKDSNTFSRDTSGVYKLKITYWYTNLETVNYDCGLGTEERCFEWVVNEEEPGEPYWGGFSDTVEIEGEEVKTTNIYELEVNFNLGDVSQKEYILSEIPEKVIVGGGVLDTKGITAGTLTEDSSAVSVFTETFKLDPQLETEYNNKESIKVNEYIGYENDFGEDLEINGKAQYIFDSIDSNLEDDLEKDKERFKTNLVYDSKSQSFVLDKVFGISKKYGIQFVSDKSDFLNVEDNKVLTTNLNKELESLGLGKDDYVNLDYTISRYFLPILEEVESNKVYKDTVILEGIGLSNITIKYDKLFTVKNNQLFSETSESIFKGYTKEIEDSDTEYLGSETISNEELKNYQKAYETKDKVNVFRDSDDEQLKEHIESISK